MAIETGLRGKVAIVTGAAAGIGRSTAQAFAREGARVAAWDLNEAKGSGLADDIRRSGGEALFATVDVTDGAAVSHAAEEVAERWGRIDVLVNNAGIVRDAQLVKFKDGTVVSTMTDQAWDAVINVNLKGVFLCTRAVVPHMIAGGGGVILNASSVVGLYGNFGQTNYAASKGALVTMTKTWAREFGRYGIRVNAVAPGFISTEMVASMPEKVIEGMVARTPLGRMGRPEEIAATYVWLASEGASFIHGAVISVDGGIVLGT